MSKVKHRHSRSRSRKRRTHYKASAPDATECPQCGQAKRPHYVCSQCGYYAGRQVKKIETLEERRKKREDKQNRM